MLLAESTSLLLFTLLLWTGSMPVVFTSAHPTNVDKSAFDVGLELLPREARLHMPLAKRSNIITGIKRKLPFGSSSGSGSSHGGSSSTSGSSHSGSSSFGSFGSSHSGSSTPNSKQHGSSGPRPSKSPREELGLAKPQFYEKGKHDAETEKFHRTNHIFGVGAELADKQNKARVNAAHIDTHLEKKGRPVGSASYNVLKRIPGTKQSVHANALKTVDKTQKKIDATHRWADEAAAHKALAEEPKYIKSAIGAHQEYGRKRVREGDKGSKRARYSIG